MIYDFTGDKQYENILKKRKFETSVDKFLKIYHKHLNDKEIKISEKTFNKLFEMYKDIYVYSSIEKIDYEVKGKFHTISKKKLYKRLLDFSLKIYPEKFQYKLYQNSLWQ